MKIISKYKDYYDYLQGIWGMDEKLVLDRTVSSPTPNYLSYLGMPYVSLARFYICGNVVEGVYYQERVNALGVFLFGDEIEQRLRVRIDVTKPRTSFQKDPRYYYIMDKESKWWNYSMKVLKHPTKFLELDHEPTGGYQQIKKIECPNDLLNCPILIEQNPHPKEYDASKCSKFPIMADYGLHKVYPAQDIWIMLGEWLGREKIIPNNQTNGEKVVSNGFDLKTSFRNPIK